MVESLSSLDIPGSHAIMMTMGDPPPLCRGLVHNWTTTQKEFQAGSFWPLVPESVGCVGKAGLCGFVTTVMMHLALPYFYVYIVVAMFS